MRFPRKKVIGFLKQVYFFIVFVIASLTVDRALR